VLSLFRHSSFRKLFVCVWVSVKIMEMEKYEVRVLLRHYWKQNYKAAAAAKNFFVMLKAKVLRLNIRCSGGLNGLRVAI
jgi:hypothetical protein